MNPNGPQPTNPDGPAPYGGGNAGIWGAVLGAGSSIYNTYQTHRDVKSEQAARKAEAELAYQRSIEMWNLQNAYNTPAQQMARFGAAGLNSQLIYGQGNSGQANSAPQYNPPNINMAGIHGQYGGAVQTIIPMLMQVGTWMQNMKLSEQELQSKKQEFDFGAGMNPRRLQDLENKLSFYSYQESGQRSNAEKAWMAVQELMQDYQYKWGETPDTSNIFGTDQAHKTREDYQGTKKLDFLKKLAESQIIGAKASWTDFNITDPQSLIEMVMKGVMGMAGQTMRINTKGRNAPFKQKWEPPKIRPRGLSNVRRGFQRP